MKGGPKKLRIVSLYLVPKNKARTDSGGEALHIALADGTATDYAAIPSPGRAGTY
jgi:hypothetical protein